MKHGVPPPFPRASGLILLFFLHVRRRDLQGGRERDSAVSRADDTRAKPVALVS